MGNYFPYKGEESHLNTLERAIYHFSKMDFEHAFNLFSILAESGLYYAQYKLGGMYLHGFGTRKNNNKSQYWYKKAIATCKSLAEHGDIFSQFLLGQMYCDGIGSSIISLQEAIMWTRKAADKGIPDAQYNMAGFALSKEIDDSSAEWLHKAAENNQPDAQRDIAVKYAVGDEVKVDLEAAVTWYRRSAENGNIESQYDLGLMLLEGEGTKKDLQEGIRLLMSAADAGEPASKKLLIEIYENGLFGINKNPQKAALWKK